MAAPVVRTRAELEARIAAGPTPLDALTPYGKRQFVAHLRWSSSGLGLGGFSYQALLRELDAEQISALLTFFDAGNYAQSVVRLLPAAPPLRLPEPSPELEHDWDDFLQWSVAQDQQRREKLEESSLTDRDASALLQRYRAGFAARLESDTLRQTATGDLSVLFEAAAHVAWKSADADVLQDLNAVFREIENRGIDTRRGLNATMLNILSATRQFKQAGDFLQRHPDAGAQALPVIVDTLGPSFQGRSVYELEAATHTLTRKRIAAFAGRQLVMLVGAGCHFSSNALQQISADPALLAHLRAANLLILTSPGASLSLDFVGDWNARHPGLPIRIPYNRQEWQDMDLPFVPMFFIFENGRLQKTVSGWPKEGRREVLLKALDSRPHSIP